MKHTYTLNTHGLILGYGDITHRYEGDTYTIKVSLTQHNKIQDLFDNGDNVYVEDIEGEE